MIQPDVLLADLKKIASDLVDDLRVRSDEVGEVSTKVHGMYDRARAAGRTNHSFEEWREDLLAQVAVGWILGTVFVRFCEDNRLYATPLLSGPGPRRELAGDHRADWLAEHPDAGDREWLFEVFRRYQAVPAIAGIFRDHNPLWQFGPTADGARELVEFWRELDTTTGDLRHDFTDKDLNTRFLGDLYQELSEHAKKTYALLQTPEFVEEFILDNTLNPALEIFGLGEVRVIDPTCGSGHFLLGAFRRILACWREREPGTPIRELVQRTLDAVNGVDLNPFAVAVARFRLLVAALRTARIAELADAPAFEINVATGDSLLHGRRSGQLFGGAEEFGPLLRHRYPTEDEDLANKLLQPGLYHVVVGNPPYITVKDKAVRDAYRALYRSASGKYSLGVPFTERFVDLAVTPKQADEAGFIGMITANTFMTRGFGRKLIEKCLPSIDLTHIIDTSGARIPGHGTPTVILFARHQPPSSAVIRSVLGIRGEPGIPTIPAEGKVWRSIVELVDHPDSENEFISVEDAPRSRYASYPWSMQGGAAPAVFKRISSGCVTLLAQHSRAIGPASFPGLDDAFVASNGVFSRCKIDSSMVSPFIRGESVRDWSLNPDQNALVTFDSDHAPLSLDCSAEWYKWLWPLRVALKAIKSFGGKTRDELGDAWWTWYRWIGTRYDTPLSVSFAFVATHNHFVLERGGNVFNRSAPVIKLPTGSSEADHLSLVGLLNSSTACFWMKQVFHPKGGSGMGRGVQDERWEDRYEFDGTNLQRFPVPARAPLDRTAALDDLAQQLVATLPAAVLERERPTAETLRTAHDRAVAIRARMVALQEELDWECYHLYGLTQEELTLPSDQVPPLKKGERAFEIVLARKMVASEVKTEWFERHGSTPITELPSHWPENYGMLVERRIALISSERAIRLLERPEYKRRWNWRAWEDLEREALRQWLLDRLEAEELWAEPELTTTARLADRLRRDEQFLQAARLYAGRPDIDAGEVVADLVASEAVPFAVGYRFKPSGLRRRREWEQVWEMQRAEDAIDARTTLPPDHPDHLDLDAAEAEKEHQGLNRIPVPPKYRGTDYADSTSWKLRGKLDMPQERFISYPGTRRGADSSAVVGWAGWDHLARARALAGHYTVRNDEGAEAPELVGMLAGLQELVPWLIQWHNDIDPVFGQRMGDFFASFVETEARGLGRTVNDLRTWTPA